MKQCLDVAGSTHTSLKQMQQLLGSVNDLGQMSPTVKFHKIVGNDFLASFEGNYHIIRMVPERLKKELEVIAKVAEGAQEGLSITERQVQPSLKALVQYSTRTLWGPAIPGAKEKECITTMKIEV